MIQLIHQAMEARAIDRRQLGSRVCGESGNRNKVFRRLDRLLRDGEIEPDFVVRVAGVLSIPPEQLAVAAEAHEEMEERRIALERERWQEAAMRRRGPHLWGIFRAGRRPGLYGLIGPEAFRVIPVGTAIMELPAYERDAAVGRMIRDRDPSDARWRLFERFQFRASLDEIAEFSASGELLGRLGREAFDAPFAGGGGGGMAAGIRSLLG